MTYYISPRVLYFLIKLLHCSGSGGAAEPQGSGDDTRNCFTLSVGSAAQIGHQHDLTALTASQGKCPLPGHFSFLPDWIHQTSVCPHVRTALTLCCIQM